MKISSKNKVTSKKFDHTNKWEKFIQTRNPYDLINSFNLDKYESSEVVPINNYNTVEITVDDGIVLVFNIHNNYIMVDKYLYNNRIAVLKIPLPIDDYKDLNSFAAENKNTSRKLIKDYIYDITQ